MFSKYTSILSKYKCIFIFSKYKSCFSKNKRYAFKVYEYIFKIYTCIFEVQKVSFWSTKHNFKVHKHTFRLHRHTFNGPNYTLKVQRYTCKVHNYTLKVQLMYLHCVGSMLVSLHDNTMIHGLSKYIHWNISNNILSFLLFFPHQCETQAIFVRNQRVARELGGAWCQADRAWLVFFLGSRSSKKLEKWCFFFFILFLVKVVSGIFVDLFLQI